jgi:hypothetical protein
MNKGDAYVGYFNERYDGRVAISVGYSDKMAEIYPIVFQNSAGESIGIVALDVLEETKDTVHIYHLGAFIAKMGHGSTMLDELCEKADRCGISLSVSAISMPNGRDRQMGVRRLAQWYGKFGFEGDGGMLRKPHSL